MQRIQGTHDIRQCGLLYDHRGESAPPLGGLHEAVGAPQFLQLPPDSAVPHPSSIYLDATSLLGRRLGRSAGHVRLCAALGGRPARACGDEHCSEAGEAPQARHV